MSDTLDISPDDSAVLQDLAAEFVEELTDEAPDDGRGARICLASGCLR